MNHKQKLFTKGCQIKEGILAGVTQKVLEGIGNSENPAWRIWDKLKTMDFNATESKYTENYSKS